MQVLRLATLALLALCAASGCRTAGIGDLSRPDPPLALNSGNAAEILAEHNRNAERIQVLEAQPALTITVSEPNKEPTRYPVEGRLTMERPRNFKLEVFPPASPKIADIGSNDTEYWFWVKDKEQKALYFCNYDEAAESSLAATLQPDWITEAMGLRIIPEAEAAEITVKPGEAGKLILTHRPHKSGTDSYTRVTILDKATHQVLEHRILADDQKTILARAVVPEGYHKVDIPKESGTGTESVFIPKRLTLSWTQEHLTLDATFPRNPRINNEIDQSRREHLFVEPTLAKGYTRINLAERTPGTASQTTIRETRPAPPSGGVRLREPTPLRDEEAARGEQRSSPLALTGAEPMAPSLTEDLVGARFPTPPEPDFLKAERPGWRTATNPGLVP